MIDVIPKSGRGKIDRNALRALWQEKATSSA